MATVPRDELPNVAQSAAPAPLQTIQPQPAAFGASVLGQGLGEIGQQVQRGAEMFAEHAKTFKILDDKATADDAWSDNVAKNKDRLFNPQTGYYTLKGKDAVDGLGAVTQDLINQRNTIAASIQSPQARQMFLEGTRRDFDYSLSDVSRHAATEKGVWRRNSADALVEAGKSYGALNYNSDEKFALGLDKISQGVNQRAALDGWGPDQTAEALHKAQSDAWVARVTRTAQDSPVEAKAMFDAHQDKFDAEDLVRMDVFTHKAVQPLESRSIAEDAVYGSSSTDYRSIIMDTAKRLGAPVTSGFRTQAEQDALRAKGLTVAKFSHHQEGTRQEPGAVDFGAAHAQQMYAELAAAGVPKSKMLIEPNGSLHVTVPKGGRAVTLTGDIEDRIGPALEQARVRATALHPDDPQFIEQAVAQTHALLTTEAYKQNAVKKQIGGDLLTAIDGGPNGDGRKPTSPSELLALYPQLTKTWADADPEQKHTLINAMFLNANPSASHTTPQMLNDAQFYRGMAWSDPDRFGKYDFSAVPGLALSDRKEFMKTQAKVAGGSYRNEGLKYAMSVVKPQLNALNIDSTHPDDYAKFAGAMQDEIETFTTIHKGALPNDGAILQISQRLLQRKGGALGFGAKFGFEGTHQLIPGIPNADAQVLAREVYARQHRYPTPDELRTLYAQVRKGP